MQTSVKQEEKLTIQVSEARHTAKNNPEYILSFIPVFVLS